MRITDFDLYKDLLREESGLYLTPDKSYFLDSRLSPVAKKWGYPSLEAMTVSLQVMPDKALVADIVEAMTINETSFFHDTRPFHIFRDTVMPYLLKNKNPKDPIRIWCAGASSGQEPYSIGITLLEMPGALENHDIEILATDISHEMLEHAREGLYTQFEAQRGLPASMLIKHFSLKDEKWQINDSVRALVRHQYFNLLGPMTKLGKFNVIFCRNVLSYFDEKTQRDVLEKIAAQLDPDGFLFMGSQENAARITTSFAPVPGLSGLYAKPGGAHVK